MLDDQHLRVCCCFARLQDNYQLLKDRLNEIERSQSQLEADLVEQTNANMQLMSEMNALKPEVKRIFKLREQTKQ